MPTRAAERWVRPQPATVISRDLLQAAAAQDEGERELLVLAAMSHISLRQLYDCILRTASVSIMIERENQDS